MRALAHWERKVIEDREHSICFTGPRPSKLLSAETPDLISDLDHAINTKIQQGIKYFINGCMAGFDILAGERVLEQRQSYPEILCITVAPFRVGYFNNKNWTQSWKNRALNLYHASDIALSLEEYYRPGIYYARNDFMLAHASSVICFYTGHITDTKEMKNKGGGTGYTVSRAYDLGLNIQNLYK